MYQRCREKRRRKKKQICGTIFASVFNSNANVNPPQIWSLGIIFFSSHKGIETRDKLRTWIVAEQLNALDLRSRGLGFDSCSISHIMWSFGKLWIHSASSCSTEMGTWCMNPKLDQHVLVAPSWQCCAKSRMNMYAWISNCKPRTFTFTSFF